MRMIALHLCRPKLDNRLVHLPTSDLVLVPAKNYSCLPSRRAFGQKRLQYSLRRSSHYSERIEYKLVSVTHKILTTTHPPYLHNLISVQPPRSTRSSYLVTLARQPTSSSLRITDRCSYASPCLWNQVPSSLRQPHSSPSVSVLPDHVSTTSPHSVNSPLSPSITPSFFYSRLKTYLFHQSFPP